MLSEGKIVESAETSSKNIGSRSQSLKLSHLILRFASFIDVKLRASWFGYEKSNADSFRIVFFGGNFIVKATASAADPSAFFLHGDRLVCLFRRNIYLG